MSSHRKERVAQMLHSVLAQALRDLDDVRLQGVTVTDVDMTPDLKAAWVFYSALPFHVVGKESLPAPLSFPKAGEIQEMERALEEVRAGLQRRVAEQLQLRFTPVLRFRYDDSLEAGSRIDELLRQTNQG